MDPPVAAPPLDECGAAGERATTVAPASVPEGPTRNCFDRTQAAEARRQTDPVPPALPRTGVLVAQRRSQAYVTAIAEAGDRELA
jgi:hypothetical protein